MTYQLLCIVCKPGGHEICHVSGALLRVRGHNSISYRVGATGLTRMAPGKLGPMVIPHRRCFQPSLSLLHPDRLLRGVCPSCSFQLHTSALFSSSAGQVSVPTSGPAPRADSPPLQGRGGGGSPASMLSCSLNTAFPRLSAYIYLYLCTFPYLDCELFMVGGQKPPLWRPSTYREGCFMCHRCSGNVR